jgi:hypothetical protein
MSDGNKNLGPDTKTDWPTDRRSQNNLNLKLMMVVVVVVCVCVYMYMRERVNPVWRQLENLHPSPAIVRGDLKGTQCPEV